VTDIARRAGVGSAPKAGGQCVGFSGVHHRILKHKGELMSRIVFGPTLESVFTSELPIPGPGQAQPPTVRDAIVAFTDAEPLDNGIRCVFRVEEGNEYVKRPIAIHVVTALTAPDTTVDPAEYLRYAAPVVTYVLADNETDVEMLAAPPAHPGGNQAIPVVLVSLLEFAD